MVAHNSNTPAVPQLMEFAGKPVTTSLQVAEYFGKRHDHVIRDIESIVAQIGEISSQVVDGFKKPKFGEIEIPSLDKHSGLCYYIPCRFTATATIAKDGLPAWDVKQLWFERPRTWIAPGGWCRGGDKGSSDLPCSGPLFFKEA